MGNKSYTREIESPSQVHDVFFFLSEDRFTTQLNAKKTNLKLVEIKIKNRIQNYRAWTENNNMHSMNQNNPKVKKKKSINFLYS